MSPASNIILRDRSRMLTAVRTFFHNRGVLEVDCPILSHNAPIDTHIDLFEVDLGEEKKGYLHSSPEYGMKRLLARNLGPIYQLSHVYRKGEIGVKHNPEFTLIEWYRPGYTFHEFLAEAIELISLFLGELPYSMLTYAEAFQSYLALDYRKASTDLLIQKIQALGIDVTTTDREELLDLLWGCGIEPNFGRNHLTVITDFPADQAMLAQTRKKNDEDLAERFEISCNQMELGNGYHELTDRHEQENRLYKANEKRKVLGKNPLPIDNHFLQALNEGIPDAYGMAIGFDRLMMLRHQEKAMTSVLPFSWCHS